MSEELIFASEEEAMQHLAEITGKNIKVANSLHPLDRTANFLGSSVPEDNYHRAVLSNLTNIIMSADGISEKAFTAVDKVMDDVDGLMRDRNVMQIVDLFKDHNRRPEFCAELLYSRSLSAGKTAADGINFTGGYPVMVGPYDTELLGGVYRKAIVVKNIDAGSVKVEYADGSQEETDKDNVSYLADLNFYFGNISAAISNQEE